VALTDIDRKLLQRCVAEQPGAWRDFVDRFVGLFVHVVRHTSHARSVRLTDEDVDDVCAEIFLAIVAHDYRLLRTFRGDSSLATYLAVVARRITVREITRRRMAEALGQDAPPGTPPAARTPAPSDAAPARPPAGKRPAAPTPTAPQARVSHDQKRVEDRDEVDRMLAGLPRRDADVVRWYHLEGLGYREIADRLGLPENTIGSTLTRARQRLRRQHGG
jgi:RNA polymerase sigma-70 factor, ECF subfamily